MVLTNLSFTVANGGMAKGTGAPVYTKKKKKKAGKESATTTPAASFARETPASVAPPPSQGTSDADPAEEGS